MHHSQVLVYENDGKLAGLLRREGKPGDWSIREPRSLDSCLRLLRSKAASVLIVKLGKDLVRELTLLERTSWLFPEASTLAVIDSENPVLAELAWDLGASFVLSPPQPRQQLAAIVTGLARTAATPEIAPQGV
jgi:hypothetical protein